MNAPKLIQLPKIIDQRGNLSFIEGSRHIPFDIKRAYWIYDVPGGETRGGHAFKVQHEFIIALSGSFDVVVENGSGKKKKYSLNRSYFGLYVPSGYWRQMLNFSTNSIALVLASTVYDENDYIRDYEKYIKYISIVQNSPKNIQVSNNLLFQPSEINTIISTVNDCEIIELDKNHRVRGNITVVENKETVPFDINRIYYLYDVPGGEERGGHAHKELYQLLIATGGSFDVILKDGKETKSITLNRPYQGLKIVPGIWRELNNFSSGSCCLVLASLKFKEDDYIRGYQKFLQFKSIF